MARPNVGEVTERRRKGGTIAFGARVYAYGRRYRLTFGTDRQGWNTRRAEIEVKRIQQDIDDGTWKPPEKKASARQTELRPDGHQLFGPFARGVVDKKKHHGLDDDTIADFEWRLGYLVGELGDLELLEIDVERVDRLRDDLAQRSADIRAAADRGRPLMETVKQKSGKSYERRKQPLANRSINAILSLLNMILQRAVDYGYISVNPLRVGERKERFLPTPKPRRSFLEVDEARSLLDAARELDGGARRDARIGRRGSLAALSLAGFRVSEMCGLLVAQVDLERARFKLSDAKTDAGVREVEMTAWLFDDLVEHRAQRLRDGFPMGPANYFFGTLRGGPRDPDRFRDRVLLRSVERANANRAKQGLSPLPRITPHSLRRTWAMLAAQAGRDPQWISDQIGHISAAFTIQIYQQTRNRRLDARERQAVWELMRFADEPAQCPLARQPTRVDAA